MAAIGGLCVLCGLFWGVMRRGREESPAAAPTAAEENIVIHRKQNDKMQIALTFDDGPHPRYTPEILGILDEYGIKATFFMIGENVKYYPAAAEAVLAAGHEVGNHTYSHRCLPPLNDHEILSEITACEDAISSVAEYRPRLIRPPQGELTGEDERLLGALDYRIILWDVDTRDWAHTPPTEIAKYVCDHVEAGDIILMHDFIGHDSPTAEALRIFIPVLLERGYHFVTVGELLDGE
jgi:peptidoglycan/xylan/chitin deacetylase (PgdA/CDA1 family)